MRIKIRPAIIKDLQVKVSGSKQEFVDHITVFGVSDKKSDCIGIYMPKSTVSVSALRIIEESVNYILQRLTLTNDDPDLIYQLSKIKDAKVKKSKRIKIECSDLENLIC